MDEFNWNDGNWINQSTTWQPLYLVTYLISSSMALCETELQSPSVCHLPHKIAMIWAIPAVTCIEPLEMMMENGVLIWGANV